MFLNQFSADLHAGKYQELNEGFDGAMLRVARGLSDNSAHEAAVYDATVHQRFLFAGRVQAAVGSVRAITPYNCFVANTIEDSMAGIMEAATEEATTLRMGGGIGYDFSTLRPKGDVIESLGSSSSGPVSFMNIFDSVCKTIASAGHRRGAQMAVMRVDHPDILDFVRCKRDNGDSLSAFNISVGVTDEFMRAVQRGDKFALSFNGNVVSHIDARFLWNEVMRSTWDWAEPGVLFLDTINRRNNLWYCENIAATNPCGEQPLPPYGACLLGSFNLTQYVAGDRLDVSQLLDDVRHITRAMDNVVDVAKYPLTQHEDESKSKRRMGLGVTGVANALEMLGQPYGSTGFKDMLTGVLRVIRNTSYQASAMLAKEKGAFPLYEAEHYRNSWGYRQLPPNVRQAIDTHGIRNSHLTSIAPTGTISLAANNISSGIEPVFAHSVRRIVQTPTGPSEVVLEDYAKAVAGVEGKTADQCSVDEHLSVMLVASNLVDSAVSKTMNVGPQVGYDEFISIYERAWTGGAKGCTTFRTAGKRLGILKDASSEGSACTIDIATGIRSCDD